MVPWGDQPVVGAAVERAAAETQGAYPENGRMSGHTGHPIPLDRDTGRFPHRESGISTVMQLLEAARLRFSAPPQVADRGEDEDLKGGGGRRFTSACRCRENLDKASIIHEIIQNICGFAEILQWHFSAISHTYPYPEPSTLDDGDTWEHSSMPPRPRYSRGCFACRRMKVKCDEQKPQCRRCLKGGRTCPGFPELSNFLSMNGDFEAPRNATAAWQTATNFCSSQGQSIQVHRARSMPVRPTMDWERCAVSYFLANFIALPDAKRPGYLAFLPDILALRADARCLHASLCAVAMTSLANISNSIALQNASHRLYGEALQAVGVALHSSTRADDAVLLTSVFLLQKRELLSDIPLDENPHTAGLVGLLQARTPCRPRNQHDDGVLHTVHAHLRMHSMGGLMSPQDKTEASALHMLPDPALPSFTMDIWPLVHRVSEVRRAVHVLATKPRQSCLAYQTELVELLDTAFDTERQLASWRSSIPDAEMPRIRDFTPHSHNPHRPQIPTTRLYFYSNIQHGCRWLTYWTNHACILGALLDAMDLASSTEIYYNPQLNTQGIHLGILEASNNILSSVPFMLGEITPEGNLQAELNGKGKALGAYFLIRFLDVINEVPSLPRMQRLWTFQILDKIGKGWGIGSARRVRRKWMQVYSSDGSRP